MEEKKNIPAEGEPVTPEAPQQAFLRPPPGAKIASVNTLALLAVSCKPENGAK